ncbi:hypothetical protein NIE79_004779 [Micromonospora sp. NIE79]|uniref:Pycsar effector protein domain-containing protein n=1 Tax=Micromonospora trifolii TaxID=2911208 RepID=A0ABS9N9R0_9ACTN|nr:hypothetical protein [Micromonospora trifolii]MCG5446211.1 hypothetical protein [Micromonospora trifolii]
MLSIPHWLDKSFETHLYRPAELEIPYKYRNKVHCRVSDKRYFDPMALANMALTRSMGRSRRASSGEDTWRDLHVGLVTAASLQASIRHADAKALALLTAEGGMAATVVDQALPVSPDGSTKVAALTVLLAATMVIAMTAATCQLALSLRPRLPSAGGTNRFGFPDLVAVGQRPSIATATRHRNEAWDFVVVLARIAMAKHLCIRRCMPWFLTSLGSAVSLVILKAFAGAIT